MKVDFYTHVEATLRTTHLDVVGVLGGLVAYAASAGTQITHTYELGLWLLIGALTGACTAVAVPDSLEVKVHFTQRAFACFLVSVIGTVGIFSLTSLTMTSDKIFFVSSVIGATGWFSIPVIKQSLISIGGLIPEVLKALPAIFVSWVKKKAGV